jgi:SAM-dependent methyltransferase
MAIVTERCVFDADYYRQNYRDYDRQNPSRKLRYYARFVRRSLVPGVPRRIHDVGCAFGKFLGSLDNDWQDWERYGSDISEYAIGQAALTRPDCTFRVADVGRVRDFPRPFGAVTAFDVIEHVPDVEAFAESVREQLAPGGSFVFVVPVYDGLSGPIIRLLDHDPTHIHKWPRGRWLDWAAERFKIVEWRGIVRYLLPGRCYLHVPMRTFRAHTPAIIVSCRQR